MDILDRHIRNRIKEYLMDSYQAGKNNLDFNIDTKTTELYVFIDSNWSDKK